MISSFVDWLVSIIESIGYVGVSLAMFIESFFAPIPSEIILPFSGFVASKGSLNVYLVTIFATISAYLGSLPFYIIGYFGDKSVRKFLEKYGKYLFISKEDLQKGYDAFAKFGNIFVLIGRVVPIVRTFISFPAGVSRMNFVRFSIYTLIGTAVWSTLLVMAGYFLRERWETVSVYVNKYENAIIALIVLCGCAYISHGIVKAKRNKNKKAD
ncbi:MAG TPA: DedA family protein [Candidatus Dojkabacteria bacterium]|nr:DedA family protein [Candidatus Dojkabacteria bacterium]